MTDICPKNSKIIKLALEGYKNKLQKNQDVTQDVKLQFLTVAKLYMFYDNSLA